MNLRQLLSTAIAVTVFGHVGSIELNHDQVQPFAQPKPETVSEKAAVKFKPMLTIFEDCHPYPAVNTAGDTSKGLKPTGKIDGKCKGSGLGSQVYGRSTWNNDLWAIMYTWYFPKDRVGLTSQRHKWMSAVVWLDNPAIENPKILAVSTMSDNGAFTYKKAGPPACFQTRCNQAFVTDCSKAWCDEPFDKYFINGTMVMLVYSGGWIGSELNMTTTSTNGEFQDLIMWEQMTEAARSALSYENFSAPFNDASFTRNLELARPFP